MPAFNLTALPGHHEHTDGQAYAMTVIELLGDVLGRARVEAKTVAEIAVHVRQFGASVAAQAPDRSFMVSVSISPRAAASRAASMMRTGGTGSAS